MVARGSVLVSLTLLLGCIVDRGFPCEDSEHCILDGDQGRCEPTGWCSYPDAACEAGHRFEALAGDGLAGSCVGLCEATSLIAGADHACVSDGKGLQWCWGANASAQLGLGTSSGQQATPRVATALQALVGIDGGPLVAMSAWEHACGLDDGNAVWCWGNNEAGQVTPSVGAGPPELLPLRADVGLAEMVEVGPRLSCAAAGASLTCWGDLVIAESPATIDAGNTIQDLTVGLRHGCVRTSDTRVYCTGDPARLGADSGSGAGPLPIALPIDGGALLVNAGAEHTCVVTLLGAGNDVVCWGANDLGQCGIATGEEITEPTPVSGLRGGVYPGLAVGARHSCVLREDGHVSCWGDGTSGQVVVGENELVATPREVVVDGDPLVALEIAAGDAHTCARTEGAVVCWGHNGFSQLGAADTTLTSNRVEFDCR